MSEPSVRTALRKDGTGRRLPAFFAASICLHAGLLLAWPYYAPFDLSGPGLRTLSIELVLAEPATPTQSTRPAPAPNPKRSQPSRETATVPSPHQQPAAPPPPLAPAPSATAPAPRAGIPDEPIEAGNPASTAGAATPVQARVQALLLTDLARHFEYPSLARRRGWQGTVLLSITVKPDGVLEHVRISQSSGYEVLDRSAVDAIQRVGQLAHAGRWLPVHDLELSLPVVYRLTD